MAKNESVVGRVWVGGCLGGFGVQSSSSSSRFRVEGRGRVEGEMVLEDKSRVVSVCAPRITSLCPSTFFFFQSGKRRRQRRSTRNQEASIRVKKLMGAMDNRLHMDHSESATTLFWGLPTWA